MKRFLLMMFFLSAAVTLLFTGANVEKTSAANYQSQTNNNSSIPYYYFENPKMLTTDLNENIYLINELSSNIHELLIFKDPTDIKKYTITESPNFIKFAGSYVFVFASPNTLSASVHIYNLSILPDTTSLTPMLTIPLPTDATFNTLEFFEVYFKSSTNTYTIFYANKNKYAWKEYQLNSSSYTEKLTRHPSSFDDNLRIGAITSDGDGSLYIAAFDPYYSSAYDMYNIYSVAADGAQVNNNETSMWNITSLTYIPTIQHFAAVANETLTLFCEDFSKAIPTNKESTFYTKESKSPVFVTLAGNKLLVIDSLKKSIDEYNIDTHRIDFSKMIVGHRGQDSGFYNIPQTLTLIGKDEYIIADISGQVKNVKGKITKDFITAEHATLNITAMCYDNWNSVFMYDKNSDGSNLKNILQYNLKGELIKKISTDLNVIQLISDPNQNILIIATKGIYTITGNSITEIESKTIAPTARAVYNEQNNNLFFAPDSEPDRKNLDVTCDALGNPIILFKAGTSYYIKSIKGEEKLENATVNERNSSLSFDRLNNKLYYIGAHHAIETATLDMWTFLDYPQPTAYKSTDAALRTDDTKFLKTKKDTVIYEYPNGINALAKITKESMLKVLTLEPEIDNKTFGYHQVIYENSKTGEYCLGYVSRLATENAQPYSSDLGFVAKNLTNSARVIFNNTIIYKYATTNQILALGMLSKNYDNAEVMNVRGVKLNSKITTTDSFGFTFYEICISYNSSTKTYIPDPNGEFVGYLNANSVIDYHLPPSDKKFVPNASVNFPRTLINGLPVYIQEKGIFKHLNSEYLKNNQEILIVGKYDKNQKYTFITYYDTEIGLQLDGWIETKYIVPYGISALQLVALITLITIIIGIIILLIIRAKRKNISLANKKD